MAKLRNAKTKVCGRNRFLKSVQVHGLSISKVDCKRSEKKRRELEKMLGGFLKSTKMFQNLKSYLVCYAHEIKMKYELKRWPYEHLYIMT